LIYCGAFETLSNVRPIDEHSSCGMIYCAATKLR
jgi:hypothetical protein